MATKALLKTLALAAVPCAVTLGAFGAVHPKSAIAPKPVAAIPAPSLPSMSAAQIVERNVQARGGLAAWQAAHTMQWKGMMGAGASTYETVTPKGQLQQKQ